MTPKDILYVGVGGMLGSMLRYVIARGILHSMGESAYAWGTLAANMVGCGLIGYLFGYERVLHPSVWLLLSVGFCGGLTTFSTFILDAHRLLHNWGWPQALGYLTVSLMAGAVAFVLGLWLSKM